ncbi:LLM class flavin-dependent oxidoreductase [Janibacter sp. G56]|uniref:LLM class flavin-dependent oxidoreductase n=1 Tax=Janibacter sp. G56 TaxID=3418717 RepID=UPI003CFE4FE6
MRHGLTILPELSWRETAPRWSAAEQMGFDHAWTYDHLVWGGIPDQACYSAYPTLAAAATVTERIGLGSFVSSPNFRHPALLARDIATVDDISGGRFLAGLGAGGDLDVRNVGEERTLRERVDRFHEYVPLLHRLLTEDHVEHSGEFYATTDLRTRPGGVREPRPPFVIAANGPRSLRLAVAHGDGWVTTGPSVETMDEWWAGVGGLVDRLAETLTKVGRPADDLDRYLLLDSAPRYSLESAELFTDMVGRAEGLGFTDVITTWPRPESPYAGSEATLEAVAAGLR